MNAEPSSQFIQQMKLVDMFYRSLSNSLNQSSTKDKRIVNIEFLNATMNCLEEKLREKIKSKQTISTPSK